MNSWPRASPQHWPRSIAAGSHDKSQCIMLVEKQKYFSHCIDQDQICFGLGKLWPSNQPNRYLVDKTL